MWYNKKVCQELWECLTPLEDTRGKRKLRNVAACPLRPRHRWCDDYTCLCQKTLISSLRQQLIVQRTAGRKLGGVYALCSDWFAGGDSEVVLDEVGQQQTRNQTPKSPRSVPTLKTPQSGSYSRIGWHWHACRVQGWGRLGWCQAL